MTTKSFLPILISLIAFVFFTCTSHDPKPSIQKIDGKWVIDSSVIIHNSNLPPILTELEASPLKTILDYKQVPAFIQAFILELRPSFRIASGDELWQIGCSPPMEPDPDWEAHERDPASSETFYWDKQRSVDAPRKHLDYFGLGNDVALMVYRTGGESVSRSILVFSFEGEQMVDFWSGFGNRFDGKLNPAEIIQYLKDNLHREWGLNTNIVYF